MPYIKKSIAWLEEMDDDKDLFPSGYGIIEIAGLNMEMIDSAVYTCMAYDSYSKMCKILGDDVTSRYAAEMYEKTKAAILNKYWMPERGLFADSVTSAGAVEEMIEKILFQSNGEERIVRAYFNSEIAKKANDTAESGWLLNEAWVINIPMEVGIATKEQADIALSNLNTDRFIGPYGMYLSGLNHKNTMTISTGVMAVAQARYGYSDRALDLIKRTFKTYSMATPGCISEMSPDYGCFVQAWTLFGVAVPITCFFFGLNPSAYDKEIVFSPTMPSEWTQASLKDVEMLDGAVSVDFTVKNARQVYTVTSTCNYPLVMKGEKSIYINDRLQKSISGKYTLLNGRGRVTVEIEK
jgi:glycogen debranching enzyme